MNKKFLLIAFMFLMILGACQPVENGNVELGTHVEVDTNVYTGPYIANTNTGKFHRDTCRFVPEILEEHKVSFQTKEAAIEAGFVGCKVCKP